MSTEGARGQQHEEAGWMETGGEKKKKVILRMGRMEAKDEKDEQGKPGATGQYGKKKPSRFILSKMH